MYLNNFPTSILIRYRTLIKCKKRMYHYVTEFVFLNFHLSAEIRPSWLDYLLYRQMRLSFDGEGDDVVVGGASSFVIILN